MTDQNKLHIGDAEYDMFSITKTNSEDGSFMEVLVVDKRRIWFAYVEYHQVHQRMIID